ncbi:hypothetical protein [Ornithinibacillus contaminans]|uniref:hypothetical protein n=1 Tax=Ornithinibacillus contaminans TaxID=694055 RepID=UPI00064DFA97|nr:hypothetical protein [Ornithinibacillus contaminans]
MNKVKQELDKITIPEDIKRKREIGINLAKSEMPRKKRNIYPVFAIAIPVFLIFLSMLYFNNDNPPSNPNLRTIESDYVIDINDPKAVVEFADNVFIGTVKRTAETIKNNYPETKYEINEIVNIKGNLSESEVINQIGGYEGNDLFLMEGDELLKENSTYLFATINGEDNNTKTIIPVGGSIVINGEKEREEIKEKYLNIYEAK